MEMRTEMNVFTPVNTTSILQQPCEDVLASPLPSAMIVHFLRPPSHASCTICRTDSPSPPQPRHTGEEGVGEHARRLPLPKARTVQLIPGASLAWLSAGSEAKYLEMAPIFRVRLKDPRQDFLLWSFELRICFSFAERGRWRKGKPRPAGLPQEDTPPGLGFAGGPSLPRARTALPATLLGTEALTASQSRGPSHLPSTQGSQPQIQTRGKILYPRASQGATCGLSALCALTVFFFFFLHTGSRSVT
uniref:Macaca fascicularis brain cDNA clone: QflA-17017, similar to human GRIP1 associated protein 1 (GRIPAP1), transcript variant2, mRNA, RefSeq: NM_207672.1 n=1 Tax=Macaca fascicularis TaxID=9541 RepID=I7GBL5_MACFA|nr:unnamed protein product [Macaca fascicularis]